MGNAIVGVLAGIVAFALLLFAVAWATGAPSAPTASISGQLNPSQAQTLSLTFATQVASTAPPNSIWQLGSTFVYTITESNANGGTTVVAQNQHVAAAVANGSWPVYQLTATVSVTTVAVCSSTCGGVTTNLTVTLQALTWGGGLSSPTVSIVFSSTPGYSHVPAIGPVQWDSYYQQALGTGLAGIGFIGVAAGVSVAPHKAILGTGVILVILGVVFLVFL